jgi:hypothetical protein
VKTYYGIRPMKKSDLPAFMAAQRVADPDFGQVLPEWGLEEQEVLTLADTKGVRLYCVLATTQRGDQKVVGGFLYTIEKDAFEVFNIALGDPHTNPDALEEVWRHVRAKLEVSKRDTFRVFVPDSEEAGVRTHLSFWKTKGFDIKLQPDMYADRKDGWKLTFRKREKAKTAALNRGEPRDS